MILMRMDSSLLRSVRKIAGITKNLTKNRQKFIRRAVKHLAAEKTIVQIVEMCDLGSLE